MRLSIKGTRDNEVMHARIAERTDFDTRSGCLLWQGSCTRDGYGTISWQGRTRLVHRLAYEQEVGPIPKFYVIDHQCRTRNCCNPDHLEAVPVHVNAKRVEPWNRQKLACPRGHKYAEHGRAYTGKDGYTRRYCMACLRERQTRPRQKTLL